MQWLMENDFSWAYSFHFIRKEELGTIEVLGNGMSKVDLSLICKIENIW